MSSWRDSKSNLFSVGESRLPLPPLSPAPIQTHSASSPSPSGANREGSPGSESLHPLPPCRLESPAALIDFLSNGYINKQDACTGYREDGMGEHTAFLLLLVATLTLSSEVSTAEKSQPVVARVSVIWFYSSAGLVAAAATYSARHRVWIISITIRVLIMVYENNGDNVTITVFLLRRL